MTDPKKPKRSAYVHPDDAAKYRWLAEKMRVLKSVPNSGKTQTGLATAIGIDKAEIGKLFKADRSIKPHQWELAQEYVGERYPGQRHISLSATPVKGVRVMGRISMGYWSKADMPPNALAASPIIDDRYPIDKQEAYRIDEPSLDGRLQPDDYVLSVPLEVAKQTGPRIGDRVVLKIERPDGLFSFTIRRAVANEGQIRLEPMFAAEPTGEHRETIVGIAIGKHSSDF